MVGLKMSGSRRCKFSDDLLSIPAYDNQGPALLAAPVGLLGGCGPLTRADRQDPQAGCPTKTEPLNDSYLIYQHFDRVLQHVRVSVHPEASAAHHFTAPIAPYI